MCLRTKRRKLPRKERGTVLAIWTGLGLRAIGGLVAGRGTVDRNGRLDVRELSLFLHQAAVEMLQGVTAYLELQGELLLERDFHHPLAVP